jgi:hypothetical protein
MNATNDTGEHTRRGLTDVFPENEGPTLAVFCVDELAKEADERVAARDDERWLALAEEGVIDLEMVPRLAMHRCHVPWSTCDDIEVHVILRAAGGASIREMLRGSPHDCSDVVRAICRLARRNVMRLV